MCFKPKGIYTTQTSALCQQHDDNVGVRPQSLPDLWIYFVVCGAETQSLLK